MFTEQGSLTPQITRLTSSAVRCPNCLDPSPTWTGDTKPNDEQVRQREEAELTLRQRQPLPTWTCDMEVKLSNDHATMVIHRARKTLVNIDFVD
ncbi:18113_t:CDS:2 [Racocetra fulgida]|uniref:18113_t:CDS:1 n=1 Tax=Racocetra fulgida TaxID=60492 RepID=A0A9N9BXW1_9GLOM|nr:18113_t:CDS:2 [Racocetra fulgida]